MIWLKRKSSTPEATERLGHGHREHPLLRGLREQLARRDALLLPLLVVRDDLLGEEPPHGLAEVLVLGLEDRALHDLRTLVEGVRPTGLMFWFSRNRLSGSHLSFSSTSRSYLSSP